MLIKRKNYDNVQIEIQWKIFWPKAPPPLGVGKKFYMPKKRGRNKVLQKKKIALFTPQKKWCEVPKMLTLLFLGQIRQFSFFAKPFFFPVFHFLQALSPWGYYTYYKSLTCK